VVADAEEGLLSSCSYLQIHLDRPAVGAVLDGIGEQIGQHLLDAPPIRLHREPGEQGGERELVAGALPPHLGEHVPGARHQVDGLLVQDQPPGLQAHHIEQV
jgi:hypothetical protein